jgi:diaminopimelate epimerase
MIIEFYKYQGTGNDFVLLDNRSGKYSSLSNEQIAFLCHRRYGIGADGLMLLQQREGYDFEMIYFNADGAVGSMCGNGGRCIVLFAHHLGVVREKAFFIASDGPHEAKVSANEHIELKMIDVSGIHTEDDVTILDTGSPHYVKVVTDLPSFDVDAEGKKVRYSDLYKEKGINVNFIEKVDSSNFKIRTYERGVEDETYSCGTGVVASSIASSILGDKKNNSFTIQSKGGELKVNFEIENNSFKNIWLSGPTVKVFEGDINI